MARCGASSRSRPARARRDAAAVRRDGAHGSVTTCAVPAPGAAATCAQNWNPDAPILPLGDRNLRGGVGCTARPTGITCKLTGGRAKGKGFSISATGVAELRR